MAKGAVVPKRIDRVIRFAQEVEKWKGQSPVYEEYPSATTLLERLSKKLDMNRAKTLSKSYAISLETRAEAFRVTALLTSK